MSLFPLAAACLLAYGMGCLSAGYYMGRVRGVDLRAEGSGSTGARNAGRILGSGAFALTFALDLAKGALAVGMARILAPGPWAAALAMAAVVAGHVWPVQLGFRGGRGISPAVGASMVLSWQLSILLVLPLLLGWGLARNFRRGGMLALVVAPPSAWLLRRPLGLGWQDCAAFLGVAGLLLWAHWPKHRK